MAQSLQRFLIMADRLSKLEQRRTPPAGASVERDETLSAWLRMAAIAAARIGAAKDRRLLAWADGLIKAGASPADAVKRLRELPRVLRDDALAELNHQATFTALLYGMAAASRTTANAAVDVGLKLPFGEAIQGLAKRVGLIKWAPSERRFKEQPAFMGLDAANRSRAFTMAWVEDLEHVDQVHEELVKTIAAGESLYDWRMKHIKDITEGGYRNTGWEGSPYGEWHYRLVYQQNLSMAYSAGRYQQGTRSGFRVVRILPSLSQNPRPEHARYAGQMFRVDEQSPLPPWDFGCNCGWEWVLPEELEGIDVEGLPLLRFDDADQQFQWRPAAYMALTVDPGRYSGIVADIAGDDDMKINGIRAYCNSVDVSSLPGRVLLIKWGENRRFDGGVQIIDKDSAQAVLARFNRQGVDLLIDREHQSQGGEFASPDGTAPAAGWIKQMEVVPNEGIYGLVEWTPWAQEKILNREYRYLSPVTVVGRKDNRVLLLESVALVNKPAIAGFPAIVNSSVVVQITGEDRMEELLAYLRAELGLGEEATAEEVLAKLKEKWAGDEAAAAEQVANKARLKLVADELGITIVDDADVFANSVRTTIGALRKSEDPIRDKALEQLQLANSRLSAMEGKLADSEWNAFLDTNDNRERVSPAEEQDLRTYWNQNRTAAEKLINSMPKKIETKGDPRGGNPAGGDRMTVINSARAKFREGANWGGRTERSFINGTLLANSQKPLSDEEAGKLAIV